MFKIPEKIKIGFVDYRIEEINRLPEDSWQHYENGGCICHANDKSECVCGAWWRE